MEEIESIMYLSYFCRMKSEEIFFFLQQCWALIKLRRKYIFFSKRKHPPDRNLTQFDPSFLIHPCPLQIMRASPPCKELASQCPALFHSCLFKKYDCTKLILLFENFSIKSCFGGKLSSWYCAILWYIEFHFSSIMKFLVYCWCWIQVGMLTIKTSLFYNSTILR